MTLVSLGTLALLVAGGALIGFLLSVLGAGGSILLLPLLVSGAALPTKEAVPLSLLVVILLALANLGPYLRRGQFAPGPALVLGMPALAGSWIGSPASNTRAGTIAKPPPTPAMPVSNPTRIPSIPSSQLFAVAGVWAGFRTSSQEATRAAAANTPSCTGSGTKPALTQLPPIQLPAKAGIPNTKAGPGANWPRRR